MKSLPQRTSLVVQTAAVLREAIAAGEWSRWLPGECELARRLHVSRVTLRAALATLEREKLIRAGQGRRREVIAPRAPSRGPTHSRTVALLTPVPLHRLQSSTVFWIDEVRGYLDAAGWTLEIHESAAAYRPRPIHALEEFAARVNPAGWVLYRSTPQMQLWFSEHAPAAVIAGSRHSGVELSSVDVDHKAGCRHAAGRFLAAGHQHLAIIRPDTDLAGDLESVTGFEESAPGEVANALHDGSVSGLCTSLDRLFAKRPTPTGLFVFNAPHLLTVLGWLQRRGLHVPRDVSLICRDDEPFLESVLPSPTRYTLSAELYARKVSRLVALVAHGNTRASDYRIMPEFLLGETLAAAR